ncbi:glycosyltransferase family 4 protein [uncultured Demequina sp.]|uniref:glycosyltransferase family 4 protein n=1 Tax=uncultured Demequina sp. TaxID=693499 RepID=UPI0025E27640|nr:glycosyltransferase family 4 protein [uncultured Demequina sp.]
MRTLFVTRKYPPSVGGMQAMAQSLHDAFARQSGHEVELIKWGGSAKWLPVVYPWLAVRTVAAALRRRPDVVYLQDGVLAPIAVLVKKVAPAVPVVLTVHGLEVTYPNRMYRRMVLPTIGRCDLVIGVSSASADAVRASLPDVEVATIANGVSDAFRASGDREAARRSLERAASLRDGDLAGVPVVGTAGRLVRRKGVRWFVDEVMPRLVARHPSIRYVVAGSGPELDPLRREVARRGLEEHVHLLGLVDDGVRNALYVSADVFAMPAIPVEGDIEGFGLVALEASSCGTPVVAAALGGIVDAVIEGRNGTLVAAEDPSAFADAVSRVIDGGAGGRQAIRAFVMERFSWDGVAERYRAAFERVSGARGQEYP